MPYANIEDRRAEKRRYYAKYRDMVRAKARAKYAEDPSRQLKATNRWKKANPEKQLFSRARLRAKRKGLPFNIELADIKIPAVCPVLGMPLVINLDKRERASPSLDRIDPALGYVKGNIQVISFRANVMKNDAMPAELRAFADWVRRKYG